MRVVVRAGQELAYVPLARKGRQRAVVRRPQERLVNLHRGSQMQGPLNHTPRVVAEHDIRWGSPRREDVRIHACAQFARLLRVVASCRHPVSHGVYALENILIVYPGEPLHQPHCRRDTAAQ